ncbi:hypothetical protein ADIARSV_3647 [Arcticibacter svalbardensis MN12-7]|uniref:LTD domain-containing protein n=1 Tax=Arcticibacter svalbardensis MN12-7 TaxID=1150600 RepID=R9GNE1_9SPHI|nr:gliding motility-associated C-terminal domain-containing protein [Arcticibacter svalbardensis]EOR93228.1 hypothetical protein ADIARSV_3647 [Arcticibacter svalbardensis MN12-7]
MKKCLLLYAIFYWNFAECQVNETFNDGNFTSSPTWGGDVSAFKINSSGKLQSMKSDSSGSKYLSTPNSMGSDCTWEFTVEMGFAPTSSNLTRIYMIADKADLNVASNAYFIQIGIDGSTDSYDLYRLKGSTLTLLIKGVEGRASASSLNTRVKINRSSTGKWELWSRNREETAFSKEGEKTDASPILSTSWFGVQCVFTKTRSDLFYFDDFMIKKLTAEDANPTVVVPVDSTSIPETGGGTVPVAAIAKNEILINELLFNPRGDGVDFLEIYNNSDRSINLGNLSVATIKKDTLSSIKRISTSGVTILSHCYLALSSDPDNIKAEYFTKDANAFLKVPALPAFSNDLGVVVLLSDSSIIDQFNYSEKLHSPLINNPDGVSLERLSFTTATNEPGNFISAAGAVGYATPGYKNSQYKGDDEVSDAVTLVSKTFSPDNDGVEDQLIIRYVLNKPGTLANITVYSSGGMQVKQISKNVTLGTEGDLIWDGADENASLMPTGIYILYIALTDMNGHTQKYRKACVLAHKF